MSLKLLPVPIGHAGGPGLWLPGDKGNLTPLGNPLPFVSSLATPALFTIVGYTPVVGDRISLTPDALNQIPSGATAGTIYYVIATGLVAATGVFELSATAAGSGIAGAAAGTGNAHIFRAQTASIPQGFKPGDSVVVYNGSTGTLVLYGAADTGTQAGAPQGPDFSNIITIKSVAAYAMAQVSLGYDWIWSTAAGLFLLGS